MRTLLRGGPREDPPRQLPRRARRGRLPRGDDRGADALGRSDLGRRRADPTAELIAVRPTGTRWGSVRDPVKSMVGRGVADDVILTMVDVRVVMRDARLAEADIDDLALRSFAPAEEF